MILLRRASFVFLFIGALIFLWGVNASSVSAAEPGDGMIVYGEGTSLKYRTWSSSTKSFSGASLVTSTAHTVQHLITRASPKSEEIMVPFVNTSNVMYVMRWDGEQWSTSDWSATVPSSDLKPFDLRYENTTGDALVVYSGNVGTTNELRYRIWYAASSSWSGEYNLDPIRTSGTVMAIRLESFASGTSNDIGLVWADNAATPDLSGNYWDGTNDVWKTEPAAAFSTGLAVDTGGWTTISTYSFDLGFESLSGRLMVIWGDEGTTDPKYVLRTAGASGSWGSTVAPTVFNEEPLDIEISPAPNSNKIAYVNSSPDSGNDGEIAIWSGTAWPSTGQDTSPPCTASDNTCSDISLDTTDRGTTNNSVDWLIGTNTEAIFTYDDSNAGGLDWMTYDGTTITKETDCTTACNSQPSGNNDKLHRNRSNPFGQKELMWVGSNPSQEIFAKRVTLSGTTYTWSSADGGSSLGTTDTAGFSLDFSYFRAIPLRTTLGGGVNPADATIGPGGSATEVDAFTFKTNTGSDTITSVTTTLAASVTSSIAKVEITNNAGSVVYGSTTNPTANAFSIVLSGMTVTSTEQQFKIRITPKSHANMPPVPGQTFTVTSTITAWTGTNTTKTGSDATSSVLTIDNLSPNDVTNATTTAGDSHIHVSWTNPVSDFSSVIVVRSTSTPNSGTPTEGTTYTAGNTLGNGAVIYAGASTSSSDTGLTNGTTYYYKIWAKDAYGNYSTPGVETTGTPMPEVTLGSGVDPTSTTTAPGSGIQDAGVFTFEGEGTVTDLTIEFPRPENWGVSGTVVYPDDSNYTSGYRAVLDGDNNLYILGKTNTETRILKYTASGILDTSWGSSGQIYISNRSFKDIVIDSSKNIYIAGDTGAGSSLYARKYNASGTLDTSWGVSGEVTSTPGSISGAAYTSIAIDSDRNIYPAGYAYVSDNYNWYVYKYNASGTLDTSWGSSGMIVYDPGSASIYNYAKEIIVDSNKNIYVGGTIPTGNVYRKYDSAGDLVTGWGSSGTIYTSGTVQNAALDTDNNLYAVGDITTASGTDWSVEKYNSAGSLDTSWGINGKIVYSGPGVNSDLARDIEVDSNKNVYVAGRIVDGINYVAIQKYTASGTLDTSWGDSGILKDNLSFKGILDPTFNSLEFDSEGNMYGIAGFSYGIFAKKYDLSSSFLQYSLPTESLSEVRITSDDGNTTYFGPITNPTTSTFVFSGGTPIESSSEETTYKIRITPKSHAAMPAPTGTLYTLAPYVTDFSLEQEVAKNGSDSNENILTIDNMSPNPVYYWISAGNTTSTATTTEGFSQINIQTIIQYQDPDFSQCIFVKSTSSNNGTPTEGQSYNPGDAIGNGRVLYAGSATSTTDSDLVGGTTYYYKIWTKDLYGNYSKIGIQLSNRALITTHLASGTDPTATTTPPGAGIFDAGRFTLKTNGSSSSASALSVNLQVDLESSWGVNGSSTYTSSGANNDYTYAITIDSDRSIYVAGYIMNSTSTDWHIRKYTASGTLDTSWGVNGSSTYTSSGENNDYAYAITIDSDRSIYVAGSVVDSGGNDWHIRKYTASGTLDTSWGVNGSSTYTSSGENNDYAYAITIDSDRSIYVAGYTYSNTSGYDWHIRKYTASGTLDTSWGVNGSSTYISSSATNDYAYAITIDSDRSIYVAGKVINSSTYDWHIRKYTASGTLDTSWGVNGSSTYTSEGLNNEAARAITIDSDHSIYVGGSQNATGDDNWHIRKYTASGTLDTSWGVNGSSTYTSKGTLTGSESYAITIDSDRSIYVAGYIYSATSGNDWHIRKYTASGTLDTSWGVNGSSTYTSSGANNDYATAITIDSDRSIYVVGNIYSATSGYDWHIRKYNENGQIVDGTNIDSQFISEVRITSEDGQTTYFSPVENPTMSTLTFSGGTPIPFTSATTTFVIRVTPKSHADMPSPAGQEYTLSPYVISWTNGMGHAKFGTDSNIETITIDNLSPGNVTNATTTVAENQITVSWDNPSDADLSQIVVLKLASSTNSTAPTEGATYNVSDPVGSSTVVYAGDSTSVIDTDVSAGTTYYYRIFAKDTHGNYSASGVEAHGIGQGQGVIAPKVSSTANDVFEYDQASVAVSPINIQSGQSAPRGKIASTTDIRLMIPSGFNAIWDNSVTSITCTAGDSCAKISTTGVTYESGDKVAVINAIQDFAKDEWIQISGLMMKSFSNANSATSTNRLRVDGAADADDDASDEKTKSIKGKLAKSNHPLGQVPGRFYIDADSLSNAELFRYRLVPTGEDITVTTTTISFAVSGIEQSDITNARLFVDTDNNGFIGGTDYAVGATGTVSVSGSNGTITLGGTWSVTSTMNIILRADVTNINEGDFMTFSGSSVSVSAAGSTSFQVITPSGFANGVNHGKPRRYYGGGSATDGTAPEVGGITGGEEGGGEEEEEGGEGETGGGATGGGGESP